jgi:peroxiredoxin
LGWIGFSADPDRLTHQGQSLALPKQGFFAPEFNLTTLTGEEVQLSNLRGRPVVINFWASWCQPCRTEMPAIEQAFQKYQAQGIEILAVNATSQDRLTEIQEFVTRLDLTFPILLDREGTVMETYQVSALPTTFFINADGIIEEVVIGGPMAEALLTSRMQRLLEGK